MALFIFTVPNWLPLPLNVLMRSAWQVRHRAQREADELVACYSRLANVPPATGRRKVTLTFHGGRADGDARLKLCLDALTHAGMLIDDSEAYCQIGPAANAPGPRSTRIALEDIGKGDEP